MFRLRKFFFILLLAVFSVAHPLQANNKKLQTQINQEDFVSSKLISGKTQFLSLNISKEDLNISNIDEQNKIKIYLNALELCQGANFPLSIKIKTYTLNPDNSSNLITIQSPVIFNAKQADNLVVDLQLPLDFESNDLYFDVFDSNDALVATFKHYIKVEHNTDTSSELTPLADSNCGTGNFGNCQLNYILNAIKFEALPSSSADTIVTQELNGKYKVTVPLVRTKKFKVETVADSDSGVGLTNQIDSGIFEFINNGIKTAVVRWNETKQALQFLLGEDTSPVFSISKNGNLSIGDIADPSQAFLNLRAGTKDIVPIKLEPGDLSNTPINGSIEYDGISFYMTTGGRRISINTSGTPGPMGPKGERGPTGPQGPAGSFSGGNATIDGILGFTASGRIQNGIFNGTNLFTNNSIAKFNGQIMIPNGASNGYVLSSDANGYASWSSLSQVINGSGIDLGASAHGVAGAIQFSDGTGNLNSNADMLYWDNSNSRLGLGISSSLNGKMHIVSSAANEKALVIQGASSQTANLSQWRDVNGTSLITIDKNGYMHFGNPATNSFVDIYQYDSSTGAIEISRPNVNSTGLIMRATNSNALFSFGATGTGLGMYESTGVYLNGVSRFSGFYQPFNAIDTVFKADINTVRNRNGSTLSIEGGDAYSTDNDGGALKLNGGLPTGSGRGGNIIFQTANGGNTGTALATLRERMRLDGQSGNLGIGFSAPAAKLDVNGSVFMTGFRMSTGASNGYVLTSDANGVASWQAVAGGSGSPGGSNGQIQFNDAGSFGGNSGLSYNEATNTLSAGAASFSSNIAVSNGTLAVNTHGYGGNTLIVDKSGYYGDGALTVGGGGPHAHIMKLDPRGLGNYGTLYANSGLRILSSTLFSYPVTAVADQVSSTPLTIQGAASQTANLTAWKNSAGTVLAKIGPNGNFSSTNGSTGSEAIGNGANITTGTEHLAIGYGAIAGGASNHSVAVGKGARAIGNGRNVALGADSTANGESIVAIGWNVSSHTSSSVVIGASASGSLSIGNSAVSGSNSVAIGSSATTTTAVDAVAIGTSSTATRSSVAIGRGATANAGGERGSVAIGYGATNATYYSTAIGKGATNTAHHQIVMGSTDTDQQRTDIYFGSGVVAASPVAYTIHGSGASGTDVAGANISIAGGKGTGSAHGGNVIFQTTNGGTSGSSLANLKNRMTIYGANGTVSIHETLVFDELFSNTSAASITIDWNKGNKQTITLDTNVTNVTFIPPLGVASLVLIINQDGSGSKTVSGWPAAVKWPGGSEPVLSTGAGAIDAISCLYTGSTYLCQAGLNFQ